MGPDTQIWVRISGLPVTAVGGKLLKRPKAGIKIHLREPGRGLGTSAFTSLVLSVLLLEKGDKKACLALDGESKQ